MDEGLLQAWRDTDYRVRLSRGGWATIRIDAPLPAALVDGVGARGWGFITAWHPHSRPRALFANRAAQRSLLADLRALPGVAVAPAVGVGASGWREPSLFAVGIGVSRLDELAARYGQSAYVHGSVRSRAALRILEP
mgnify:CR=1 FL=1